MFEEIKAILENYTDIPMSEVKPDSYLQRDLELNSLDVVNLVVDFEEKFNIEIKDDDIRGFLTIKDIMDYIEKLQQK